MRAGRAGVDHGGDSLGDGIRVGRNAERRHAVVDVRVNIDQPGRDDLAACVECLPRLAFGNLRQDRRDLLTHNADITFGRELLRRVDHAPAAN